MRSALEASLRASPWAAEAAAIATLLQQAKVDETRLEASVRGAADGSAQGGRMMIEGVSPTLARVVVEALGFELGATDRALLDWAREHGQPAIVGWDASRDAPVAKLYVNASDAARALRRSLGAVLGLEAAPHVVGVNLGDGRRETKVYEQHAAAPASLPQALQRWAEGASVAGWVVSRDLPSLTLRATFAGLHPTPGAPELERLPGWGPAHVEALPFPIGFAKSVGFDATGERWVAYVKGPSATPAAHDLEPVVCLRAAGSEIGLFLEPAGGRAYAVVRGQALSYRIREGAPPPAAIEAVMGWAVARLEAGGEWHDPPSPWEMVRDG